MYRLQLQHNIVEHPLTQTITFRIAEAGFVVKINIFAPGLKFQADLVPPPADLYRLHAGGKRSNISHRPPVKPVVYDLIVE